MSTDTDFPPELAKFYRGEALLGAAACRCAAELCVRRDRLPEAGEIDRLADQFRTWLHEAVIVAHAVPMDRRC